MLRLTDESPAQVPLCENMKFLRALSTSTARRVVRCLRALVLPPGTQIFKEEDKVEQIFLIMAGSVRYTSTCKTIEERVLREGAHFGHIEVACDSKTRVSSASSEEEVILLLLAKDDYVSICRTELEQSIFAQVWLLYEMPLFYSLSIDQLVEISYLGKVQHFKR
eukprot:SAG31_NODE_10912_length_1085_cov_0.921907_2_plen_164_part_01